MRLEPSERAGVTDRSNPHLRSLTLASRACFLTHRPQGGIDPRCRTVDAVRRPKGSHISNGVEPHLLDVGAMAISQFANWDEAKHLGGSLEVGINSYRDGVNTGDRRTTGVRQLRHP